MLIPPSNVKWAGRDTAGPPPWYDDVIPLTLEEAAGLFEMGVAVYMDYATIAGNWAGHFSHALRVSHVSHLNEAFFDTTTKLYFLLKENADDTTS